MIYLILKIYQKQTSKKSKENVLINLYVKLSELASDIVVYRTTHHTVVVLGSKAEAVFAFFNFQSVIHF